MFGETELGKRAIAKQYAHLTNKAPKHIDKRRPKTGTQTEPIYKRRTFQEVSISRQLDIQPKDVPDWEMRPSTYVLIIDDRKYVLMKKKLHKKTTKHIKKNIEKT